MKIQFVGIIIVLVSLTLSGCVTETESNKQNHNVDQNNIDNNNQGEIDTFTAGWMLKEIRDYGNKVNSTNDYYTYDVFYERNNITTMIYGGDGQEVKVRTTWTTPPESINADEEISIFIKKEGITLNHGGLGLYDTSSIIIDFPELELGYASSSIVRFSNETYGESLSVGYGDVPETIKQATFTADAPSANGFNGNFSITITCKNGAMYGTEYVYEWVE